MSEGIIAQYGFLFQRYVFIDTAISHASMDLFFTYEGVDDIDVNNATVDEDIALVSTPKNTYLQVKSGTVSKECWAKVLGNWILTDDYEEGAFELICENELEFDISDENTIETVYKYFENGSKKDKRAIAKKVYEKLFRNNSEDGVRKVINDITTGCSIRVCSMDSIMESLNQKISETYCTDIKIYERAKQSRTERLLEYLMTEIDAAIRDKNRYTLTFQRLMDIVGKVKNEISDEKYIVDTSDIKKKKKKEVEALLKDSDLREIRQLRLVKNDPGFIARELVNELLYKDFRDVYEEGGIEVSNIEDDAHTNYQDTMIELDGNPTPKDVFVNTTKKEIHSSIMPDSPIYRNGCYVYLTGEEIDDEKQITWGVENE